MGYNKIIIALTIIGVATVSAQCQKRKVRAKPDPIAVLQNILSPSNKEGALQLLKFATAGAKSCHNPYVTEEVILPTGYGPNVMLQQNLPFQSIVDPRIGYPNLPCHKSASIIDPRFGYPNLPKTIIQEIPGYQPIIEIPRNYHNLPIMNQKLQEVVQPIIEVPRMGYPGPQPIIEVPRMGYPTPVVSATPNCGCQPWLPENYAVAPPCSVPAPIVNPYLPAASPVSAIAPPTSNQLPPAALTQSRCNFLRKIPIPPPTL